VAIMQEPLPEPRIKIEPIDADGSVTISFNQDMVAPDTLDPSLYPKIFSMKVESGLDGTSVKGDFENQSKSRRLEGLDENDAAAALTFALEVTEHTARGIKIKAVFDNPAAVSALSKDKISFQIKELSLFKSASNLKPLDKSAFGDGDGSISKVSPPMITDEKEAENIASTTDTGGSLVNVMSSGNVFVTVLLGGTMQELWGMIRAMQMIVLSILAEIQLPVHTFLFYQESLVIADMDIFMGETIIEAIMRFKETDALNDNFELYGIGDKNFMSNSGSYFLI
jgi:hypothetical protein